MAHVRMILTALLLCLVASAEAADDFGAGNARARLVTDSSRSLLGVHFDIKPGWHIYWRYPGDAGLATDVQWRLPEGVSARSLLWPIPVSFVQSGDLAGYGYEDEVVLAAEFDGESLAPGTTIGAEVSWLACKDVCVVGSAELESTTEALTVEPSLESWRSMLPRPLPDDGPPFEWRTTGGFDDGRFSLWLQWPGDAPEVEWYPDPPEAIEIKDVRVSHRASLTRIDASVRRRSGAGDIDILSSLVVVTAADGSRSGWELELVIDE